jgi:hypothetical protein
LEPMPEGLQHEGLALPYPRQELLRPLDKRQNLSY